MSKAKFDAARQLIQEKKYDQARALLETIDHPTAIKWLAKLDEIAPKAHPKPKRKWTAKKLALLAVLSVPSTCLIMLVLSALIGQPQQQAVRQTAASMAASMQETCTMFRLDDLRKQACEQAAYRFLECGSSATTFESLKVCHEIYRIGICSLIHSEAAAVDACIAEDKEGQ